MLEDFVGRDVAQKSCFETKRIERIAITPDTATGQVAGDVIKQRIGEKPRIVLGSFQFRVFQERKQPDKVLNGTAKAICMLVLSRE